MCYQWSIIPCDAKGPRVRVAQPENFRSPSQTRLVSFEAIVVSSPVILSIVLDIH